MTIDSPIGNLTLRAYDHQVMFPMYMGVTTKVPGYDFLMVKDLVTLPGKDVMPTIAEIKKARGK